MSQRWWHKGNLGLGWKRVWKNATKMMINDGGPACNWILTKDKYKENDLLWQRICRVDKDLQKDETCRKDNRFVMSSWHYKAVLSRPPFDRGASAGWKGRLRWMEGGREGWAVDRRGLYTHFSADPLRSAECTQVNNRVSPLPLVKLIGRWLDEGDSQKTSAASQLIRNKEELHQFQTRPPLLIDLIGNVITFQNGMEKLVIQPFHFSRGVFIFLH